MGLMDSITGEGLYLDTNIFIYALEGYPKFIASVRALFAAISRGENTGGDKRTHLGGIPGQTNDGWQHHPAEVLGYIAVF